MCCTKKCLMVMDRGESCGRIGKDKFLRFSSQEDMRTSKDSYILSTWNARDHAWIHNTLTLGELNGRYKYTVLHFNFSHCNLPFYHLMDLQWDYVVKLWSVVSNKDFTDEPKHFRKGAKWMLDKTKYVRKGRNWKKNEYGEKWLNIHIYCEVYKIK